MMKIRSLPVILLCLLAGLFISAAAQSQELSIKQKILMPGPLIEGHAQYETQCEKCHSAFSKEQMSTLCLDCHEDIAGDRSKKAGFHGQSPVAATASCETCHTDHEGRDADILNLLSDSFNHRYTRFALEGAHQSLTCSSCHEPDKKFRDADPACSSCHSDQDIHQGVLGTQCAECHQASSWQQRLPFDHSKTDFALQGQHQDLACSACHLGQKFEFSDTRCISCHKADDVHAGSNGQQCDSCHRVQGWDQLSFDHDQTDFPLRGKHADIRCSACHADGQDRQQTTTSCNGCHRTDDIHLGRNGEQCESCHNSVSWRQLSFDHQRDTDFPLTGQHLDLRCTACHSGALSDPLARDCGGCHAADDVHRDPGMTLCGTCHSTDSWTVVSQFDHDITAFPLIGMHQIVPCHSCHIGNQFNLANDRCDNCHRSDDIHEGAMGADCQQCHTPNAWGLWQFDHARQANYPLRGKHQDLACASCHAPGSEPGNSSNQCGSCHRSQDIHNGEFGDHCERCHNTDNFFDLILE